MNQELYLRLLADYIYQGYQLDIARMLALRRAAADATVEEHIARMRAADAAQAQVEHQKDKDDVHNGDWTQ